MSDKQATAALSSSPHEPWIPNITLLLLLSESASTSGFRNRSSIFIPAASACTATTPTRPRPHACIHPRPSLRRHQTAHMSSPKRPSQARYWRLQLLGAVKACGGFATGARPVPTPRQAFAVIPASPNRLTSCMRQASDRPQLSVLFIRQASLNEIRICL